MREMCKVCMYLSPLKKLRYCNYSNYVQSAWFALQTTQIAYSYYNYGILVSYFYFHGGS